MIWMMIGVLISGGLFGGVYYLGMVKTPQPTAQPSNPPISNPSMFPTPTISPTLIPVPADIITTPLESKVGYYNEQDAKIWVDIDNITSFVNSYYYERKVLPKSLDDLSTLPDLSFFKPPINPINNKPYTYVANPDNSAYMVSGVMHDGVEYKRIVPTQIPIK